MQILFAISILSFLALAWAAISVARTVRQKPAPVESSPEITRYHTRTQPKAVQAKRPRTSQRYDKTYASEAAGDLNDPIRSIRSASRSKAI